MKNKWLIIFIIVVIAVVIGWIFGWFVNNAIEKNQPEAKIIGDIIV